METKSSSYKTVFNEQCKHSWDNWKNKKSQERSFYLKNTINEIKNSMDGFKRRMEMKEEKEEFKDISVEMI